MEFNAKMDKARKSHRQCVLQMKVRVWSHVVRDVTCVCVSVCVFVFVCFCVCVCVCVCFLVLSLFVFTCSHFVCCWSHRPLDCLVLFRVAASTPKPQPSLPAP